MLARAHGHEHAWKKEEEGRRKEEVVARRLFCGLFACTRGGSFLSSWCLMS